VSFDRERLLRELLGLAALSDNPERLVIAYSGGLDSTVLIHALAVSRDVHGKSLLAVYVDHGLHEDSGRWGDHCESFASSLDVEFTGLAVDVMTDAGKGSEAAARTARYDVFRSLIQESDWLLSAHHKDDQAETLLLNLMRGSGPSGLAGIGEIQPFGLGWLVRPLLPFSQSELRNYATQHELSWIDDPSNDDRQFDRNFLRHEILPRLEERWPGVSGRLQQSAVLASEAATMLDQLADDDLQALADRPDRLSLDTLRALPPERQRNVIRYVVRELGLPAPPATQLRSILADLLPAREDAQPLVQWKGAEVRRYRDRVYILSEDRSALQQSAMTVTSKGLDLGAGMGELQLDTGAAQGLAGAVVDAGLEVRFRSGGEEIKPAGQLHTRKLKKLLQDEGIVPWMRDRLPLLYSGGELVAVADLWLASAAVAEPGVAVCWNNRPPIH
jgi:tRNA(Ile)-lysidine synthase